MNSWTIQNPNHRPSDIVTCLEWSPTHPGLFAISDSLT